MGWWFPRKRSANLRVLFVCVCVCERERERNFSHPPRHVAQCADVNCMSIFRNLLFCSDITVLLGAENNPCDAGARTTLRCSTAEPLARRAKAAQQSTGKTLQIPFQNSVVIYTDYSNMMPHWYIIPSFYNTVSNAVFS